MRWPAVLRSVVLQSSRQACQCIRRLFNVDGGKRDRRDNTHAHRKTYCPQNQHCSTQLCEVCAPGERLQRWAIR